jgi:hypothetical protein
VEKFEQVFGGFAIQRGRRGFADAIPTVCLHKFHDDGTVDAGAFGTGDFQGLASRSSYGRAVNFTAKFKQVSRRLQPD